MPDWPHRIAIQRFEARQVTALTGVAEDRQRLIASRHFDFRESIQPEGKRRRWTWEGIQALIVFTDVMANLRNAERAEAIVKHLHQDQSFVWDSREDDGDALIVVRLDTGEVDVTNPAGLAVRFDYQRQGVIAPASMYIFNLTAMQRDLCAKVGMFGSQDA